MTVTVTATCRTEFCTLNGVPNVFEREIGVDGYTFCGQCQNLITDITVTES